MTSPVTVADIRDAAALLAGVIEPTPTEGSRVLSALLGHPVHLKCENLQRTGSFKLRGAYNRIARLDAAERVNGVVCASAGNHAQGVALGARMQGVKATVFMPENAPLPKVQATEGYGAIVRLVPGPFDEALTQAKEFAEQHDRVFVHPFDHPHIIAGQGTIGFEIAAAVPDVATVLVPIGGGGLISGVAIALRSILPNVRIVGVQAAGAASFGPSLAAGEPLMLEAVDTIADGIAVKRPGQLTLPLVRELVDEIVTVDDASISRAVVQLLERAKLVVEPSGAVSVAAMFDPAFATDGPVVGLLSGGNIDPLLMQHLVAAGLTEEGRYVTIRTTIEDEPGELQRLLGLVAEQRANVVAVEHYRFGRRLQFGQVEVVMELETRGHEHIASIRKAMKAVGYPARIN